MSETITQAAVVDKDGTLWTLPAPARHCHILRAISDALRADGKDPRVMHEAQGFIAALRTSHVNASRYVSRSEAYRIALAAGQIRRPAKGYQGTKLFSEDVW